MAEKSDKSADSSRLLPRSLITLFRKSGRSSSDDLLICKQTHTVHKHSSQQSPLVNGSSKCDKETSDDTTGLKERRQTIESSQTNNQRHGTSSDFRSRTQSMPASHSILKKNRHSMIECGITRTESKKQFCFKEDVDVIYYDEGEQTNEFTAKNLDRLKIASDIQENTESKSSLGKNCDTMFIEAPLDSDEPLNCVAVSNLILHKEMKVMPCIDSKGCRRQTLRILIKSHEHCLKDRTSVKALSGGSSIVVTLHRKQNTECDSPLERHVEKLLLPVIVDPYKIKAHLHKTGELEINAPLKDQP